MDRWDVLIVAVAGYIAITALTRLMLGRRNRRVAEFREQIGELQKKKKKTAKKAKKEAA